MADIDPPAGIERFHRAAIPPPQSFLKTLGKSLKETFFPDDPLRQFKNQPKSRKIVLGLQYLFPILEWAPRYTLSFLKADLIAGVTIASLAIPQGISYAKLANLPPVLGLYSSFVPPLIYAVFGSSRDLAVGTMAVGSLLISAMIGKQVNPIQNPSHYLHLAFTATFFSGVLQASLGILRLGFIVDFLSHATIVGFTSGAATVVCLQQLKTILGLNHSTHATDIISVLHSVFTQTHHWRWESALLGCCFLVYLLIARYFSKKKPSLFWISAIAPLTSLILGSGLVYVTRADKHGVQVIGALSKGLNPLSLTHLSFGSQYLPLAIKTGIITGIIALAEGVAVGRSFAIKKNYNIDGNKEMIAFGLMNIAGSCTSCYLTTGPFSRTAVNFNAGGKTLISNVFMSIAVMITLLLLTSWFYYTPLVVLSAIIISAMVGLIDYKAAIHLWKVDKYDFLVCIAAYIGVVFRSIDLGLIIAIILSLILVLFFMARPRTFVKGEIPKSSIYRSVEQYTDATKVPGIQIIEIGGPIYFTSAGYLRERIGRWIDEEEDKLKSSGETSLQYVVLDMGAVANIDTSGISMLQELKKSTDTRELKLALANPTGEVMKKMDKAKLIELIGKEWIYLTVGEAVAYGPRYCLCTIWCILETDAQICVSKLLSLRNVRSFASIREDEVLKLVKSIKASIGMPVNVTEKVYTLVSLVTARAAFGKQCEDQDAFVEVVKEGIKLAGGFDVCDLFPSMKILNLVSGLRNKLENLHLRYDVIADETINEHKENLESTGRRNGESGEEDLVDVLLRHQKSGDLECHITTDNIKVVIR